MSERSQDMYYLILLTLDKTVYTVVTTKRMG